MNTLVNKTILFLSILLVPFGALAEMSPETVQGATTIDGSRAKALFDAGALFVDPRKNSDWEAGRVPGALHLELNTALTEDALLGEAEKGDDVVFYCNGIKCTVSTSACEKAVAWGFKNVYYYRTGFPDWKERGYPVE